MSLSQKEKEKEKKRLYYKILKEVQSLPPIPAYIKVLKEMLDDPAVNIPHLAAIIKKDISLAAEVLRVANSAKYMFGKRISNIDEAVRVIGFKELDNIMTFFSAKKIIEDRFSSIEDVWKHSYRTAFFAQQLARVIGKSELEEDVHLAGLLHDMGKMALLHISPELVNRITKMSEAKKLNVSHIERLAIGINHAEVGGLMAERWNYPDELVQTIYFHHEPLLCLDRYKPLVYIVYLSNVIDNMLTDETLSFATVEKKVLEFFGLNEHSFYVTMNTLKELYEKLSEEETLGL